MSYNVKITEYADGTAQVRFYNGVISGQRRKSKPVISSKPDNPVIIYATMEELIEMAERVEEEKKLKAERSLRSSVSRTRSKIEQLARSGNFDCFCTLTYSPQVVDRYNYDETIHKFIVWLQNIKRICPDIQALFVPEFHYKKAIIDEDGNKRFAVHFHGLIGSADGLELVDVGVYKGKRVYKLENWKFGISHVTKIENKHAICRYIRKYCTKDSVAIARTHKGRHRYFKTGLTVPREKKILINGVTREDVQKQLIESYAEKHNLNITRKMDDFSEYGYIPVKCVELAPEQAVEDNAAKV